MFYLTMHSTHFAPLLVRDGDYVRGSQPHICNAQADRQTLLEVRCDVHRSVKCVSYRDDIIYVCGYAYCSVLILQLKIVRMHAQ